MSGVFAAVSLTKVQVAINLQFSLVGVYRGQHLFGLLLCADTWIIALFDKLLDKLLIV